MTATTPAPALRDALKHRAAINRKTRLPRLFDAGEEIGKGQLRYQVTREECASSASVLPPKAAMITPDAPTGPGYCRPTVT